MILPIDTGMDNLHIQSAEERIERGWLASAFVL